MAGFGNQKNQKLKLTLDDVKWIYAPEPNETSEKQLDEVIGDALIQWIYTGEIWLITDGKKPFMICHASSVVSEKEMVMIRVKILQNETLTAMEDRMNRGMVLTRFEILRFDAKTSDVSFVFKLKNQKEARQRATSSFDIILLAANAVGNLPRVMSFIDIGSKADRLFEQVKGSDQKQLNDLVIKLSDLSDQWCSQFDGDRYVDRFRERISKPIVLPTEWDEI